MTIVRSLCLALSLALYTSVAFANSTLAIFQFEAVGMKSVGLDSEVLFNLRGELFRDSTFSIVPQRDMETQLTRNDIKQTFDRIQAQNAARLLGVDFVLIGRVERLDTSIVANVELISPLSNVPIAKYVVSFNGQQDIARQIPDLVAQIKASTSQAMLVEQRIQTTEVKDWADAVKATLTNTSIKLSWTHAESAPQSIGYNIYRATDKLGPFSYINSVLETEFFDDLAGLSGEVFYQVSMLDENAEEIRSPKITGIQVSQQNSSQIVPPAILSFTKKPGGPELSILPSAKNASFPIVRYELLRREEQGNWNVVDSIEIANDTGANRLQQYLLKDESLGPLRGEFLYAVRAATKLELGQLSERFVLQTSLPPSITSSGTPEFRSVSLEWPAVKDALGYVVYRRNGPDDEWQNISEQLDKDVTQFTDTNIEGGQTSFEYAVSLVDEIGESAPGSPKTFFTKPALKAPVGLKLVTQSVDSISLQWDTYDDPDLVGFAVYRAPYADGEYVTLGHIGDVIWSQYPKYTDTENLQPATKYQYAVAPINVFGDHGNISVAIAAETLAPNIAVKSIEAELQEGAVLLTWQIEKQDVELILLERSSFGTGEWTELAILGENDNSFTDNSAPEQGEVQYRISTISENSEKSPYVLSLPLSLKE